MNTIPEHSNSQSVGSSHPRRVQSEHNSRRPSRRILRHAREFAVVFVGVWLALAAEAWRDRRAAARRTNNIVRAIQADIHDLTTWYGQWRDSVGSELQAWENARAAGEDLIPYYVRIPGSEQGDLIGWQVALASSALDVLDPELLFELGRVSREWDGVGERFARYMSLTEILVFPQLAKGSTGFYDPDTGELKPEFVAHVTLLKELLHEMDQKVAWIQRLDVRISKTVD